MVLATMNELALVIVESDDQEEAQRQAERAVNEYISRLFVT
jgi:hypothetical protein